MTVKEMMMKLLADAEAEGDSPDIDFCDDYDESAWCAYCGNHWSEVAEEHFKTAFNLEVYPYEDGDDCVLVKCANQKEVNALHDLLFAMAGYIADDVYDIYFPEPEEPEEYGVCYFAYKQEVCEEDGCGTHEETFVKGYSSGVSIDKFFRDVSYMICFDDCEPREVVEIVWQGKKVTYDGWRRGMYFGYSNENGKCVWGGSFPEWDH